jgi:lipopolysaccharide export LptBFGC system permease protein LptF
MDTLKKYLLKEFVEAFLLSLLVFTLVFTVGNIMQVADLIINKGVNIIQVIKVFFLLMPSLLTFTIPMAVLLSSLLTFGRLAGDSEIQAMMYSGISLWRIAAPVIIFVLVLGMLCVLINDRIATEFGFEARH